MLDICEGVRYIHSRDLIHRDIKSPNIFITAQNEAKLGDFGLCINGKTIVSKVRHSSAGIIGTNCYMAPELHKGQIYSKGKASDMWAVGCILLEMLLGTALWDLEHDFGIKSLEDKNFTRDYITNNENLQKYDFKLLSLLKKLLHPDPQCRLTVDEFFKKKYVRQCQNKLLQQKKRKSARRNSLKVVKSTESESSQDVISDEEETIDRS